MSKKVGRPSLKVSYWTLGNEEADSVSSFDGSNVPASRIGFPSGFVPDKVRRVKIRAYAF
jgi:hypothetical protein